MTIISFDDVVTGTLDRAADQLNLSQVEYANLHEAISQMAVQYTRQDKFTTIAVLVLKEDHQYVSVGASKRNPTDRPNDTRGKALALTRAVRLFVEKYVSMNRKHEAKGGLEVVPHNNNVPQELPPLETLKPFGKTVTKYPGTDEVSSTSPGSPTPEFAYDQRAF